jgi:hypothetical protein
MRSTLALLLASLPVVGLACAGDEFTSNEGLGNTTHLTTSTTAGAGGGGSQGGGAGGATTGVGGSGGTTTGSGGTGGTTTGSGGTGGAGGGGGGAGGGGGGGGCTTPNDCPSTADFLCIKSFTCSIEGKCVPQGTSSGTPIKDDLQVPHDCKTLVCDGNGGTKVESSNDDGPTQDNVCAMKSCDAGEIESTPVAAEPVVPCGMNGVGTCANGECNMPTPSCNDGVKNGDESDVDCGSTCDNKKCPEGKHCANAVDCESGLCGSAGICLAKHCDNGWMDQGETGQDCGGPCNKCDSGKGCKSASDCVSGECTWRWLSMSMRCE